jgi:hypothetical protein
LKICRLEIIAAGVTEEYEDEFVQVLFDLYGLRLNGIKDAGTRYHRAKHDKLTKASAISIIPFVLRRLNRVNLKEILKTDYKATLDKMRKALAHPQITNAMKLNAANIHAYVKSAINPQDLYQGLRGIFELTLIRAEAEMSVVADMDWFLLLGRLALSRFCTKRVAPGATEDLELANACLKHDLMYGRGCWETWYGLAAIYDARIAEESQWTADKLNNDRPGLDVLQRQAIHCYVMAVSLAVRKYDPSPINRQRMSTMYSEFGNRMYASSRPPYSSTAFWLDEFEKPYSSAQGIERKPPHPELTEYKAWSFARVLFQRALVDQPELWTYDPY